MVETTIRDHKGQEHVIRSVEDANRLVAAIEVRRDRLADLMCGNDLAAAITAERESDIIETTFLPVFQQELARVQALLDEEANVAHRHAKARAIKERARIGEGDAV